MVTGYGMVTPLGGNATETFDNACRGASGIRAITSFDTRGLPTNIGGEIDPAWISAIKETLCEANIRYDGRMEKFVTRSDTLILAATLEAVGMAGLQLQQQTQRIGVSLGNHGQNPTVEDMMFLHRFCDGKGNWDVRALDKTGGYPIFNFFKRKPDVASALVAAAFRFSGPNLAVSSACAAGAQAIGEAFCMIREGRAQVMIAGGAESCLDYTGFVGFVLIKALVQKYASPQRASRPFDRRRNGFVMSEGAGALVLEDLEHAVDRNAPIYGELLGYGSSADAYRITDTHPKGEGAILAMRGALRDANLLEPDSTQPLPNAIDYINAHGTSTIQNDLTETLAIKQVFGPMAKDIPISSNKSMLGHTIAAAGAIEAILSIMGINHDTLLPTINYEHPDPKCDLDYVPNQARHKQHRRVLSNSFGFGGQNACLCIGKFE
ncbi:3-oxoacyl-ACP synthase [Candidatus Magnetobacterium bavaricum]|uniref:3-oxoacyl-ACP synthase n=1 Tax=Candidatus Magnetobacterium bavaricum TaxID=29290 RepID=A0A0F3GRN0_9BACT|nr:3-oxoacyl-ACP synthase [Candidatus Magnetobacterium bavaricum]